MIGVFDSGIGGLSILQALRTELPHEDFIYVSDSAYAPYGERSDAQLLERSHLITQHLYAQHIKALVIACNTATAAAIGPLRTQYPQLPIVGVEPAIKPAVQASRTHRIGVMATRSTLASYKFQTLLNAYQTQAEFILQPCDGLAYAIESNVTDQNATKIVALCLHYTRSIGEFGLKDQQIDTLVLGCTHYSFAREVLHELLGPDVQLIDTSKAVAQQTHRLLPQPSRRIKQMGQIQLRTTGSTLALEKAAARWLGLDVAAMSLSL